jgi:hypothetical protein
VLEAPDGDAYYVALGRIGVRVEAEAIGESEAVAECYSWILQGASVDDALAHALVRRNASLRVGALCVDGEGAVILRHALLSGAVDEPGLQRVVEILAHVADEIDSELRAAGPWDG